MNQYYYLDCDNYYLNSESGVLRNKLDIEDAQKLDETDYLLVSIRLAELYDKPFKIETIDDICKIYKYFFQDIYEWAGGIQKS